MARKPNTLPSERMHLVQFNNISWGSKLLIPAALLSQFSQLMSLISIVEEEYLQGGAYTLAPTGDVDYGITTVSSTKHVICSSKQEAKAFKAYHDAAAEMMKDEDKVANQPVVSLDEFRTNHKEEVTE